MLRPRRRPSRRRAAGVGDVAGERRDRQKAARRRHRRCSPCAWVKAEVAVNLRRSGKRAMSPIAAMTVAATTTLTPGTVISRLTSGQDSASAAIGLLDAAISCRGTRPGVAPRRPSPVRRPGLEPGQPAPTLDTKEVGRRWAALEGAQEHRVDDRSSRACAPHELGRRPSRRRIALTRSSGTRPRRADSPRAAWRARERRGDRSFARAWRIRAGRRDEDQRATYGSMMRAIAQALPVTSSATWSWGRGSARTARAPRLRLDPAGRAELALLDERDLAEVAWTSSAGAPDSFLLPHVIQLWRPVGKPHRRIRARGETGQFAGSGH